MRGQQLGHAPREVREELRRKKMIIIRQEVRRGKTASRDLNKKAWKRTRTGYPRTLSHRGRSKSGSLFREESIRLGSVSNHRIQLGNHPGTSSTVWTTHPRYHAPRGKRIFESGSPLERSVVGGTVHQVQRLICDKFSQIVCPSKKQEVWADGFGSDKMNYCRTN